MRFLPLLLLTSLLPVASCAPVRGGADLPPNVLLIITDDQGWGDVRSHGNDQIDTPVHDRLAAEGARFDRFYVSPVCAPTRASLMTGRYHLRTGTHGVTRGMENMRADEVTVAEAFQGAGYRTGCFGKWHNGSHYPVHPNGQGFEEFVGFCAGHWNNYYDPRLQRNGKRIETRGYITDVITDEALKFIDRNQDRPFFCYVPYNAPHGPFQVPDPYFKKYKDRGLSDKNAAVYGMVENIDDNMGRLLDRLDALGLARRTIVVFLTDNGPNGSDRFNGGMRGAKGSVHEGGVRVPLFVRWPGRIRPGTSVKKLASHIDLFPTLVDLAGIPMPATKPLDGVSLLPLLEGNADGWPDRLIFSHQARPGPKLTYDRGSIRSARWRMVTERNTWQLYDMLADPGQKKDLASTHPDILALLRSEFERWFRDVTSAGFDPIPFQLGHEERPAVELPAHEAVLRPARGKGIRYADGPGFAHDWVTEWTSAVAYPEWRIEVVRPGQYEVSVLYTCSPKAVGSTVRVAIGPQSIEGRISKPFDPVPVLRQDRAATRKRYTKDWAALDVGTIDLPRGQFPLTVRGGASGALDLKAVRIRRID